MSTLPPIDGSGSGGVMDGFDLLMSNQNRKRMVAGGSDSGGGSPASSVAAMPQGGDAVREIRDVAAPTPVSVLKTDRVAASVASSLDDSTSSDDLESMSSLSTVSRNPREQSYMPRPTTFMTPEQVAAEKREILYQLSRLESKGIPVSQRFTMSDSLDDMRAELERLKLDREVDLSVRFQKRVLMTCVNGIELLNRTFDPFGIQLNGWSDSMHDSLGDYDEVLEDLHMKYRSHGVAMAPELKLLLMIGGSGVMFHMTASMFKKSNVPDLHDVLRQNPELMSQIQSATMKTAMNSGMGPPPPAPVRTHPSSPAAGGSGMLGSLFGNLFGSSSSMPPPPPPPQPSNPPPPISGHGHGGGGPSGPSGGGVMRGPKPVQDMLRDMHKGAFDRVDILNDTDDDFLLSDDDAPASASASASASAAPASAAAPPGPPAPKRGAGGAGGRGRRPKGGAAAAGTGARNTVTVGM